MRIEAFPQTIIDKLNKPGCEKESTSFSSKLENLLKMDKVTLKGQYHRGKIIFLFFFVFKMKRSSINFMHACCGCQLAALLHKTGNITSNFRFF